MTRSVVGGALKLTAQLAAGIRCSVKVGVLLCDTLAASDLGFSCSVCVVLMLGVFVWCWRYFSTITLNTEAG